MDKTQHTLLDGTPIDPDAEQVRDASPGQSTASQAAWRTLALEVGLVLTGGVIGTLLRVLVSVLVGDALGHGFPYDIAIINVSGSLLIGLLAGWRDPHSRAHELIWLAGAVGMIGAYTTFSSYVLGVVTLDVSGKTLVGLLYLSGSAALGLLAVEVGLWLGERWRRN